MKRPLQILTATLIVMTLSACVAGSGESAHAAAGGLVSQVLLGFWHGLIAPLTLIGEIVTRVAPHLLPWHVHLYETRATGVAYDVGFYLGMAGTPSFAWHRWSRRG